MDNSFEWNAPQYLDFKNPEERHMLDTFFDSPITEPTQSADSSIVDINFGEIAERQEVAAANSGAAGIFLQVKLRRSLSAGQLVVPAQPIRNEVKLKNQRASKSKERINNLAKPKKQQKSVPSLAEAVQQFHVKTPKRFRSCSPKARGSRPEKSTTSTALQFKPLLKDRRGHEPRIKIRRTVEERKASKGPMKALPLPSLPAVQKAENGEAKGLTHMAPFSFEQRDRIMMQKKEEKIKKVYEEERRARQFHANPIPQGLLKARNRSVDRSSNHSNNSSQSCSLEEETKYTFKAKPATVLQQKHFEPKMEERYMIPVEEFQLRSDKRAEQRQKFDNKVRQKQLSIEEIKTIKEREQQLKEEEERANLRKLAEHKAQPIRKFKEVKIVPPATMTVPVTPKLTAFNKKNVK